MIVFSPSAAACSDSRKRHKAIACQDRPFHQYPVRGWQSNLLSFILGSLSFSPSSLYSILLALKSFFSGRGFPLMRRDWNVISLASSHFRAFWQVVHFGYSTNSILVTS